jgi:hypothetical protein
VHDERRQRVAARGRELHGAPRRRPATRPTTRAGRLAELHRSRSGSDDHVRPAREPAGLRQLVRGERERELGARRLHRRLGRVHLQRDDGARDDDERHGERARSRPSQAGSAKYAAATTSSAPSPPAKAGQSITFVGAGPDVRRSRFAARRDGILGIARLLRERDSERAAPIVGGNLHVVGRGTLLGHRAPGRKRRLPRGRRRLAGRSRSRRRTHRSRSAG